MSTQERIFGSKRKRIVTHYESTIDGTRRPITVQEAPPVTMSAYDVIVLIQRELKRDLVDQITIIAV